MALLNYRNLARAQDDVLADTWVNYMQTGRSFQWSADMDRKLEALTPDQVNAALRKYLKPEAFSTAVAGISPRNPPLEGAAWGLAPADFQPAPDGN